MILLYAQAVAAVALLALSAAGLGRCIERILPRDSSQLDRIACSFAGGLGILGTVLFVAGQLTFTRAEIAAVLFIFAIWGVSPGLKIARYAASTWRSADVPKLAAATIAFVLLITAFAGLAEITGDWGNDAIAYHLLGPKVWLHHSVIRPVLDNCHTAFPQILEVLFGALMAIGGPRAPGFSAVLTFSVFLLVVAAVARRAGLDSRGAWWAVALVAAMPTVYAGGHTAFVDVFYAALVLTAARIGLDAQNRAEFLCFGVFAGLAMGTKYPGILAFAALLVCVVAATAQRCKPADLVRDLAIAAGAACFVAAPFYLRNWILLGSPIYPPPPVLLSIFHPKYMPADMIYNFQTYILQRGQGLGRGPLAFLALPFQLTYHTSNFHGAGGIGLAPLALAPIGMLASWRNGFVKTLALLALLLTVTWFVTQQESRFLIHVYVISAILAVAGWQRVLAAKNAAPRLLAAAVIAISIAYGCFMIVSGRRDDLHSVWSSRYAMQSRAEQIPFPASFNFLNRSSVVRNVLILDRSVPPYYLDKDYVKPIGQWGERVLPNIATPADALDKLQDLRVSHVLDVKSSAGGFQVATATPGLTLVFEAPTQRIYQVEKSVPKTNP
jgi:hypothetical protein